MTYHLCLYVSGRTPSSMRAIANMREICARELAGEADIEVVDVLEHPSVVEDERLLATPTLVRYSPRPQRRVLGDLGDRDGVLRGLDLGDSR